MNFSFILELADVCCVLHMECKSLFERFGSIKVPIFVFTYKDLISFFLKTAHLETIFGGICLHAKDYFFFFVAFLHQRNVFAVNI